MKVTKSVALDESTKEAVEELAKKEGRSFSGMLNHIIKTVLNKRNKKGNG